MKLSKEINLVGVSFWDNRSLSERYLSYLKNSQFTSPSTLLFSSSSCVVVATAKSGTTDSLTVLSGLSSRHGFSRCSGRMFVMEKLTQGLDEFYQELETHIPAGSVVRTHAHPKEFSQDMLDFVDSSDEIKSRNIISSPTSFTHLVCAVLLDKDRIGWGVYTSQQYKDIICRPGDGERSPTFELNFNRAELKLAEAVQLLTEDETDSVFSDKLVAVDVGAAPGGWSGYLASRGAGQVYVAAVDPAALADDVASMSNVVHVQARAEEAFKDDLLANKMVSLVGQDWSNKFRLLVCDANLDIRDTVRELILPLSAQLVSGGLLIVTVKLGRRVGVEGIARKLSVSKEMLVTGGFREESIRVHWLFGNSKNERTLFAVKI